METKMSVKCGAALSMSLLLLLTTACSKPAASTSVVNASSDVTNSAALAGKVSMTIKDMSGTVIYSDTNANSSLILKAGQMYSLDLTPTNVTAGATYSLLVTRTDIVGGAASALSVSLNPGSNSFTLPNQGDYSFKLVVSAPSMTAATQYYRATVSCANPTLTASSLNASKISVASGSTANLYNLSSAGVTADANGTGPYLCAFDGTGTGILDTSFQSCDNAVSGFYSNYVGSRNVSLIVKDSCNATVTLSNVANLAYTVPAMPGNVFIFGQVSGATGSAVGDNRIDGVNYLATNTGQHDIVQPMYSNGSFTISAAQDYGQASSVRFGMQIEVTGITDTIDMQNATGSVDASSATISKVTFSTDQAGDQLPAVSFTGRSCVLSNQGAKALVTAGMPCTSGTTGDNTQVSIEVYGNYNCTGLTAAGATINVKGSFDGYYNSNDNCVGGGGGGGGGIAPVKL